MDRKGLASYMRRVAEYFGLAGQAMAEEATDRVSVLEAQVEALELRVAQYGEDVDALRAEVIRLRGRL